MPRNTSSKITYEGIDISRSIFAIIKEINPSSKINKNTMEFLNNIVKDFTLRIIKEADELRRDMTTKKYVTASDIMTSIKLINRNQITENMVHEGSKLVEVLKSKQ